MISDLRERAIGESLGREAGRQAYDKIPEDDRVKDEEEINKITEDFNNELQSIVESGKVLDDQFATIEDKRNALQNIKMCKMNQKALYESSSDLFNEYMKKAKDIYSNPADERSDEDLINLLQIANSWDDSEKNLESDVKAIDNTFYFLDNPQKLFKEPSPSKGTVDTDYYIDIPPMGVLDGMQMWPKEEREVVDLNYDSNVHNIEPQSQQQEGIISTSSIEKVTIKTTRYGINAFMHKFKSFAKDFWNKISGKGSKTEEIDDKSNDERN